MSLLLKVVIPCRWLVLATFFCTLSGNSAAHSDERREHQWKTLETDHFLIHFDLRHKEFAQRMAAIAEHVYGHLTAWLQWQPRGKTELVIDDSVDRANGFASPIPYNRSTIYMQPPIDGELIGNEPWLEQVFTHEFIHILHLDQNAGFPSALRRIFARVLFSFPQIFSPRWVTEGLAVYGETDEQKGFGRGQSAIYQAMMRTEVRNGLRSLTELSYHGYIGTDWPRNQVYLYGYYFFEFIESVYGKEKILAYIRNWNDNVIPWRMDARASQVFGVSGEELWFQFQNYLHEKFDPQISLLASHSGPVTAITTAGDKVVSNPVWLDNDDFYYYENDGRNPARLMLKTINRTLTISDELQGFIMFDVNQRGELLMSRFEICDEDNLFADLYLWKADQQDWHRLTHCGRYLRAFWSNDGSKIVAVKMGDGKARLQLLEITDSAVSVTAGETLAELALGDTIGDLNWSPDGLSLVASVKRQATGWNLERFDLKEKTWKPLTRDSHIQRKPRFSRDGKSLYYLSDLLLDTETQTQQLTVVKMDLQSGFQETLTTTLSALLEFTISPTEDRLRAVEYTSEGQQIVEKPIAVNSVGVSQQNTQGLFAVNKQSQYQVPAFVNSDSYFPTEFDQITGYNPLFSMQPRAWWVWLTSDSAENTSAQLIIDGLDARENHYWQAAPELYFDRETAGGSIAYLYKDRFALIGSRDIETVQEEDSNGVSIWDIEERLQAIYIQPFISLNNRLHFSVGLAAEWIERVFENGNNSQSRINVRDNLAGLAFNWDTSQRFVHSISEEHGRTVRLTGERFGLFSDERREGYRAYLDWREFFSLGNSHVLALRYVEGLADDNARRFRLGGATGEFATIAAAIGFGRDEFMLRGYGTDNAELTGQHVRLGSVEWRFPLFDLYDGFFVPPLGLGKGSMKLFVDTGAAWDDGDNPDYFTGAGLEFSPQVLIGYDSLPLNMSFGAAYGFDNKLGGREFYFRLGIQL